MEREPTSLREVRCARCHLQSFIPATDTVTWCGFCREYADVAESGPVQVWRLTPDKVPVRCDAADLGNWMETGRQPVAYTVVRLRDGTQTMLNTMFVCVDASSEGDAPLLFRTALADMETSCEHDGLTRRYATIDDAKAGHAAILAHLRACDAVIPP